MKKYLILISFVILLSSCSKHWCETKYPKADSVSFIQKLDTAWLQMPADTTYIETPADCPDQQIIYKDGKIETRVVIKDKILKVYRTSKADSIQILSLRQELKEFKQQEIKVPVYVTPKWAKKILFIQSFIILAILIYWQRKNLLKLIVYATKKVI